MRWFGWRGTLGFALMMGAGAAGWTQSAVLPDAPSTVEGAEKAAPKYAKYIGAGQKAVPFQYEEKMEFGLRDAFSLQSVGVWGLAAGWEWLINTSPNYGEDGTGFAKRLGAAAVRDTSETLLVDSVFAPLFHEDPRYYKVGPRKGVAYRAAYAITRPLITRTDTGGSAPNAALLAGDLAGTVLTNAYYPARNRGFSQTGKSFGFSLGAIALGNAFHEFKDDALDAWRERRSK